MSIALNSIHNRTMKCWTALQAQPTYFTYMPPRLRVALQGLAEVVVPALAILKHQDPQQAAEVTQAEKTIDISRNLVMQVQDGIWYQYRNHPDLLRQLSPLNCGGDPAETGVRLATLVRELPGCQPAFIWLPGEGITLAALKKQIVLHGPAVAIEAKAGTEYKGALKTLRDQRRAAHELWDDDGFGLESWIIATIPKEEQLAFGRERRKVPRKPKTPAAQETKDGQADPKSGGEEKTETKAAPKAEAKAEATTKATEATETPEKKDEKKEEKKSA